MSQQNQEHSQDFSPAHNQNQNESNSPLNNQSASVVQQQHSDAVNKYSQVEQAAAESGQRARTDQQQQQQFPFGSKDAEIEDLEKGISTNMTTSAAEQQQQAAYAKKIRNYQHKSQSPSQNDAQNVNIDTKNKNSSSKKGAETTASKNEMTVDFVNLAGTTTAAASQNNRLTLPPLEGQALAKQEAQIRAAEQIQKLEAFKIKNLEEKKEMLKNLKVSELYTEGSYCDAQDTTNEFIMAKIIEVKNNEILVNYDGWSTKWNTWFKKKSYQIAPFRTEATGYSGQVKLAIRPNQSENFDPDELKTHLYQIQNLINSNFEGKDASYLSQYVRGHLFAYMDSIIGFNWTDMQDERSSPINTPFFISSDVQKLIRAMLRLIVAYLRKLRSLQVTIYELQIVPKLFLVDSQAALFSIYPEIFDWLSRLFACDGRTLKYYVLNDENQIQPDRMVEIVDRANECIFQNSFGVVVKDYSKFNFLSRRQDINQEYKPQNSIIRVQNQNQLIFGSLNNFVQYFADIGGFNAILDTLTIGFQSDQSLKLAENSGSHLLEKIPLRMIPTILVPFRNLRDTFNEQFAKRFVTEVRDLILLRLNNMSEREVKELEKDQIFEMLSNLTSFFKLGLEDNDIAKLSETMTLQLSLRFLKSENLEKRLKGLQEIRMMVERVNEAYKFQKWQLKSNQNLAGWLHATQGQNRVLPSEYIKTADLRAWLVSNSVLATLLGGNAHIEIVKRSGPIINFLAKHGSEFFDDQTVQLIWKCQQGKHEEMVRCVYNLIEEIIPTLSQAHIDVFFSKIRETPVQQFDEKFIQFLSNFTKMALRQKAVTIAAQTMQKPEYAQIEGTHLTSSFIYEQMLQNRERELIKQLSWEKLDDILQMAKLRTDYGLQIFMQMCLSESASKNNKHWQLIMEQLKNLLKENSLMGGRTIYLAQCLQCILQKKSVVQSLTIAEIIIQQLTLEQIEQTKYFEYYTRKGLQHTIFQYKGQGEILQCLHDKLCLIDSILDNLQHYQILVSQQKEQIQLVEDPQNSIIVGKYSHQTTIMTFLNNIDFLMEQGQKWPDFILNSEGEENVFSIGVVNFKRLWDIFCCNPNFQIEQTLFFNWIIKDRSYDYCVTNSKNQQIMKQQDFDLMKSEERNFWFKDLLCGIDQLDLPMLSPSFVRVFEKYFRIINIDENNMRGFQKKIKVLNLETLTGLDTLWLMSTQTNNEKTLELSQELLVNIHLKVNPKEITFEEKRKIVQNFVVKCMDLLTSSDARVVQTSVIRLLSTFLDRYEGKKPLTSNQFQLQRKLVGVRPIQIKVNNSIDPSNRLQTTISIGMFQTFGQLRQKIAEVFSLEINQFLMFTKDGFVDPDHEDDNHITQKQSFPQRINLQANPIYEKSLHPKIILSETQNNFNTLFAMLSQDSKNERLSEKVWTLISKLPQNQHVVTSLQSLTFVKEKEDKSAAWSTLLDPNSIFKLLYCLDIISSKFMDQLKPQIAIEDHHKADLMEQYSARLQNFKQQEFWKWQVIQQGGFSHLLFCLKSLPIEQIKSTLELKVTERLIQVIFKFIGYYQNQINMAKNGASNNSQSNDFDLRPIFSQASEELRRACIQKIIGLIEKICSFSVKQESLSGESFDKLQQKIQNARLKKQKQRMLAAGNQADKKDEQAKEEEDEEDSDDKSRLENQIQEFRFQAEVCRQLFSFIQIVTKGEPQTLSLIYLEPELEQIVLNGAIRSQNSFLREQMGLQIKNLCCTKRETKAEDLHHFQKLNERLLRILIHSVFQECINPTLESRCADFLNFLAKIIKDIDMGVLETLMQNIDLLIQQICQVIIARPTKEMSSNDLDVLLDGLFVVLQNILGRLPSKKQIVGSKLTYYLIHDCLFEIPHGSKKSPKCKAVQTRQNCLDLLQCLACDCLENLHIILDYTANLNKNQAWRTNKESDWSIKLQEDEKSTTGRVGIKNLGCICYMNSLNQQLFMIPGFRNDILSIKDPNNDNLPDEDNMFLQWQNLFAGLLLSQKISVNPKQFCHAFKDWEGQSVNVMVQMDVEEYFLMFMDKLENAIKGTPQAKTIQYHFGGKFASEIICKTCPHFYERAEDFLSLGVTVKNKKSLTEGLQNFVQGDNLDEDNQYFCEKCDKKVDALKRTCLKQLPRYLIVTLKRFDFDYDTMTRVKFNDYFAFDTEIDIRQQTQEYLNKKEKAEKQRQDESGTTGNQNPSPSQSPSHQSQSGFTQPADQEDIKMKQPEDYYKYELVGIVVHTGTANSGHYYSFIREQDGTFASEKKSDKNKPTSSSPSTSSAQPQLVQQQQNQQTKWYEFNDHLVSSFDPADIPSECFGGDQRGDWNNGNSGHSANGGSSKFMNMRNAYILIYRRKLQNESLLVKEDDEGNLLQEMVRGQQETTANNGSESATNNTTHEASKPEYTLGRKELVLDQLNPLNRQVQAENSRYWSVRLLFRAEYQQFVTSVLLYWNQRHIIPALVPWRTKNYHLLDQKYVELFELSKIPIQVKQPEKTSQDLEQLYPSEQIMQAKIRVFKFAFQFYYTILQRSQQKQQLPDLSCYLKAYINENLACAEWLIFEFVNMSMIDEVLIQNPQKLMRQVFAGIITCAIAQLYPYLKDSLNQYWDDVESGMKEGFRETCLGNFILCLLSGLPQLRKTQKTQEQYFQILAFFARMGPEARQFLMRANSIYRLLNLFYYDYTPQNFKDDFNDKSMCLINFNDPTMGNPTVHDPEQKKSAFDILKERERLKNLQKAGDKKNMYLIETLSLLLRTLTIEVPDNVNIPQNGLQTPYQLENSGISEDKKIGLLLSPGPEFLMKIFYGAKKARSAVALSQAYMHLSHYDLNLNSHLFETILKGCNEYDYHEIKPFLILFQHMLESAANSENQPVFAQNVGNMLTMFFENCIGENNQYFQWMEAVTDWLIKVAFRVDLVASFLQQNENLVSALIQWHQINHEPPSQFYANTHTNSQYYSNSANNQEVFLNKQSTNLNPSEARYDRVLNQTLNFYRKNCLIKIKMGNGPSTSHEVDIDYYHLGDVKLYKDQPVQLVLNQHLRTYAEAKVSTCMDELAFLSYTNPADGQECTTWEPTDKGRILLNFVLAETYQSKEMAKLHELLLEKQRRDKKKKQDIEEVSAASNSVEGTSQMQQSNGKADGEQRENEDNRVAQHQNRQLQQSAAGSGSSGAADIKNTHERNEVESGDGEDPMAIDAGAAGGDVGQNHNSLNNRRGVPESQEASSAYSGGGGGAVTTHQQQPNNNDDDLDIVNANQNANNNNEEEEQEEEGTYYNEQPHHHHSIISSATSPQSPDQHQQQNSSGSNSAAIDNSSSSPHPVDAAAAVVVMDHMDEEDNGGGEGQMEMDVQVAAQGNNHPSPQAGVNTTSNTHNNEVEMAYDNELDLSAEGEEVNQNSEL